MNYRLLGKTGLKVSEISLGCWAIGGPNFSYGESVGWHGADDQQSLAGLHRAFELGINHFDTADVYGNGHSERLVGKFLQDVPRDQVIIATKVGWFDGCAPHRMYSMQIRHQFEMSLDNLGTDYVDIYYFHNADFGENDQYLTQAVELVHRFQQEGKIRFIGQSAYAYSDFVRVAPVVQPDVFQFQYHALQHQWDNPASDLFRWAAAQNLGLIIFGPLAQGALLDKYSPANPPKFEPGDNRVRNYWLSKEGLQKLQPALLKLKSRFGSSTTDLVRMALQYALSRSKNAIVIPGFKNPRQVEINAAADKPLSIQDVQFIRETLADLQQPY